MNAKTFFYVSGALLLLVTAYSIGASRVTAQSGIQFSGIATDISQRMTLAITTGGDIYGRQGDIQCGSGPNGLGFVSLQGCPSEWVFMANVLSNTTDAPGLPSSTLSRVKNEYRK